MRIEDPEPAAGHHRHYITTAKAKISIRGKRRILFQGRRVTVRVHGTRGKVISPDGAVRREWSGHKLINSNTSPRQRAVQSANKPSPIGIIRRVEQRRLLHGPSTFSEPHDFKRVAYPAAEFLFRTGATRDQCAGDKNCRKKWKGVS